MSQYRTGTVSLTSGSHAVVGTGTAFLANVPPYSLFTLTGSSAPYVVGVVTDDTHLTLTTPYADATASGLSYAITTSFTPSLKLPYPDLSDIDAATISKQATIMLDSALNSTEVDNVAALKALPVPTGSALVTNLLGYYMPGDGGSQSLFWNATDTRAGNDFTIYQPNSAPATGRWNSVDITGLSVLCAGAKGDYNGTTGTDNTAAFTLAQTVTKHIIVPPGKYLVDNLRIQNGVKFHGSGYDATVFIQKTTGNPAINITSDATTGQLLSLDIAGFSVTGNPAATAAAVLVSANGVFAVSRSNFDFAVLTSFRALEIQCIDANNVYNCAFRVVSNITTNTAVVINGGVYNTFDFFLTGCMNGIAIDDFGFNCTFTRLVSEGQLYLRGQNTLVLNPTIEEFSAGAAAPPYGIAIFLQGFNQTLINPTIILTSPASLAKLTYAFSTFCYSILTGPRIIAAVPHPFTPQSYPCTIIGPGQNLAVNKMEATWTDLSPVSFVGNCSQFTAHAIPKAGRTIQYLAPAGAFNLAINNDTDAMVFEPASAIASSNINLPARVNNQSLSLFLHPGNRHEYRISPGKYPEWEYCCRLFLPFRQYHERFCRGGYDKNTRRRRCRSRAHHYNYGYCATCRPCNNLYDNTGSGGRHCCNRRYSQCR
ncbi:MAG: hypothetical protein K2P57_01555 [Burkholderiales bacterium]|nr:hypothetical protein [Burkholderiales bacterium]